MADFYIKKLIASGKGKQDAIVDFTPGLNIIHGLSDTGKSCILLSIDYVFGGKHTPFNKKTGYDCVNLEVQTEEGEVFFERQLGRNIIKVESTDPRIESADYDREHKDDTGRDAICEILLRLIGIEEEHRILYNKDYVKKRLTWRSFSHMFVINEDDVHTKKPIMLPKTESNSTYFLSALWFLLTGKDYAELDEQEERRIRTAKKDEIIKRINNDLTKYSDKKAALEEKLRRVGCSDVMAQAQNMIAELNAVKERISAANERSRQLLGEIMVMRQTITDCDMHIGRFLSLQRNFQIDVKRLSMIADSKAEIDEAAPYLEECPICGSHVLGDNVEDIITAANGDLRRIVADIGDLSETITEQKETRAAAERELARLEQEKADIDRLVEERLAPRKTELAEILKNYRAVSQFQAEIDLFSQLTADCERDLNEYERGNEPAADYRVKEHYKKEENFANKINEYVYGTFEECRYEHLNSAYFSIDKFEVFINGQEKSNSHGQGYRAFINTVLALAFRKYLHDFAIYKTGLFLVDSPLQSLKQGVEDLADESMRTGLFRYLLNHQNEGQVIVIENDIPPLEYGTYGVKPMEFTGGKKPGRYGFLYLDGQF
jgi:DNA repair exonuclease SbcCD ATPase subunit